MTDPIIMQTRMPDIRLGKRQLSVACLDDSLGSTSRRDRPRVSMQTALLNPACSKKNQIQAYGEDSDTNLEELHMPSSVFVPLGTHIPFDEWINSDGRRVGPFYVSDRVHPYALQFGMYTFGKKFLLRYM